MKKLILAFLMAFGLSGPALANTCSGYPYTLTNGTTADANQVMANFNNILNCANSNLQPLLTLPLSIANGGTGQTTASSALTALGGLAISNNLSDLASAGTARTNLGLGTAATQNTGTSGANVPLLNGTNTWSALNTFNAGVTVGSGSVLGLDASAGNARIVKYTTGGVGRWQVFTDSTAESGANAGSNFVIQPLADNGSGLPSALTINRASGLVSAPQGLNVSNGLAVTGSATVGGQAVVTTNDVRFGGPLQNPQNAPYTFVITDAGAQIIHNEVTARTYTIPSNASVSYPVVTKIELVNTCGSGAITLNISTDTLSWYPAGTTGSRTLAACGIATLTKITTTVWVITGVGIS